MLFTSSTYSSLSRFLGHVTHLHRPVGHDGVLQGLLVLMRWLAGARNSLSFSANWPADLFSSSANSRRMSFALATAMVRSQRAPSTIGSWPVFRAVARFPCHFSRDTLLPSRAFCPELVLGGPVATRTGKAGYPLAASTPTAEMHSVHSCTTP